ncbi:efflux transporter outer membrane subunit [uncultured Sphingomonas sp.]|uniref:efflux transporter outer membrane subunit n=1 Tax=uncultured Sphingomonas sp. TaxID=158754 RepID=UPI0035CC56D5
MDPRLARPEPPVPPSWPVGDAYLRQSEATLPAITYREMFRDRRLQAIIEQAIVNNRDLRIAVANIRSARALYRIQRADRFPRVDVTGRYQYSDGGGGGGTVTGNNGGTSTGGTGTGTGGTGTGTGGSTNPGGAGGNTGTVTGGGGGSLFQANIGVTAFEIDLFGRVASLTRAAQQRYFAQEAAARATRLILVGDIAQGWLTYAADLSLLRVAERTAQSAESSVRLTRARLEGGIVPRSDLTQAQQVLATAQADLAEQRTFVAQDVNAVTLLVGASVDPTLLPASIEEAAPTLAVLPAGLDSRVLLRRPDVVQAEYDLRATNAEIGAARAALFPRISLTGILGFASNALGRLFTGDAFSYSVSPTASYSIFRAGAARANVEFSRAQRDAALAGYERAIQIAFREVADALARQGTIAEQLRASQLLVNATDETLRLNDARYRGGIDTFLTLLDAQRSAYTAQRTFVATQLAAATNRVALYRALGGDATLETTATGPVPVSASGARRTDEPLPVPSPTPEAPRRRP